MFELNPGFQIIQGVHLVFCTLAFWALFFLRRQLRLNAKNENESWVALFVALAILMWVAIDITRYIFDEMNQNEHLGIKNQRLLFINLFSSFNNAFFLAAAPSFRFGFEKLKEKFKVLNNSSNWALTILIINIIIIIFYIINWSFDIDFGTSYLVYFDILYSVLSLGIFGYALVFNFIKLSVFGRGFNVLLTTIIVVLFVGQFSSSTSLIWGSHIYRYISLYSFHFVLIVSVIMLLLIWNFENIKEKYEYQLEALTKKISEKDSVLSAFETEIESMRANIACSDETRIPSTDEKRYLKFFRENKTLVIELTMLDKSIIKAKMYFSSASREYKDLLRFALYQKLGITIRTRGGAYKGFGDIYKSILDIRKRLINPKLVDLGFEPLKANELIIQKIKGSGVYGLECTPKHIEIDVESLSTHRELATILSILDAKE